jgi:hypothetical protein
MVIFKLMRFGVRLLVLLLLLSSGLTISSLAQASGICDAPSGICLQPMALGTFAPENKPVIEVESFVVPGLYEFIPENNKQVKITIYKDDLSVFVHYRRNGFDWSDPVVNSKVDNSEDDFRIGTAKPSPESGGYELVLDPGVTFRLMRTMDADHSFCYANDQHRYHYPTRFNWFNVKRGSTEMNFETRYVIDRVTATNWWISTRWCSEKIEFMPNTARTYKYE